MNIICRKGRGKAHCFHISLSPAVLSISKVAVKDHDRFYSLVSQRVSREQGTHIISLVPSCFCASQGFERSYYSLVTPAGGLQAVST